MRAFFIKRSFQPDRRAISSTEVMDLKSAKSGGRFFVDRIDMMNRIQDRRTPGPPGHRGHQDTGATQLRKCR